ncbi:substrate-binding domain-containing protein [Acuticoccus sp. MNP-M23]|uniref:substrate-binding domain-containing protein n=1 Tax=Acuticoccus sp. MNP-M23 TaxID=3072793 RepID=UPI00281676C1|nr:substrate-binding domain-containing protein [Acuticoccus sp. MNP-M23]WMS41015.1 substrate-binding domain-containing protein [Acuticoccus sp. MNP-M23]
MIRALVAACLMVVSFAASPASAADEMRMAVTTSFHNSGLAEILLPEIAADTGIDVALLVVGTGQALRLGRAGDVDAILVHSRAAEDAFVAEGFAPHRREIMYNDFVIVGPQADPAGIHGAPGAVDALTAIAVARTPFVSRGDDSGTHRREQALWESAGKAPEDAPWYRAVGAGMGATLNAAAGMNAYALTDRATWLNFQNKGDLALLYEGDPALFNQYAFLPIAKARHPHAKAALAARLEDWLVSDKAQAMIGAYTIAGEQLFVPNAKPAHD